MKRRKTESVSPAPLLRLSDDALSRCLVKSVSGCAIVSSLQRFGRLQLVCKRFRDVLLYKTPGAWDMVRLTDRWSHDSLMAFVVFLCTRVFPANRIKCLEGFISGWNDERASASRVCDILVTHAHSVEEVSLCIERLDGPTPGQSKYLEPERLQQAFAGAKCLRRLVLTVTLGMTVVLPSIPGLRVVLLHLPPTMSVHCAAAILNEQTTLEKVCVTARGWHSTVTPWTFVPFLTKQARLETLVLKLGKVSLDALFSGCSDPLRSVGSVHIETSIPQLSFNFLGVFPCVKDLVIKLDDRARRGTSPPTTIPFLPKLQTAYFSRTFLGDGAQAIADLVCVTELRLECCGLRHCDGLRDFARLGDLEIREQDIVHSLRGVPAGLHTFFLDAPLLDAQALAACRDVRKLQLFGLSRSVRNVPWASLAASVEKLAVCPVAVRCLPSSSAATFPKLRIVHVQGPAATEEDELGVGTLLEGLSPAQVTAVQWVGRRHESSLRFAYLFNNAARLLLYRNPEDRTLYMKD